MPRKPFAVEQFTLSTFGLVAWIPWGALLFLYGGYRNLPHIMIGFTLGFWLPALAFAVLPVNPYNFWMDRTNPWRRTSAAELDLHKRRVLVAFYDPQNRRRAALAVLAGSLVFMGLWVLSLIWVKRAASPVWRIDYLVLAFLALAVPASAWLGYAGLATRIREDWPRMISQGHAWPEEVDYPGPWKDRLRSFLTGRMPSFLMSSH